MANVQNIEQRIYFHIKFLYSTVFVLALMVLSGVVVLLYGNIFIVNQDENQVIKRQVFTSVHNIEEAFPENRVHIKRKRAIPEPSERHSQPRFNGISSVPFTSSKETVEYCTSLYNHCNVQNRGEPGPPGPKGSQGEKGTKGLDGKKGERGFIGRAGTPGIDGTPGHVGSKGDRGPTGPRGVKGMKGEYGMPGIRGPVGKIGPAGVPGPRGLKGEKGIIGERGLLGFPGFKGKPGEPGMIGDKGERGQKGNLGPMGPPGIKGSAGMRGAKGDRGRRGFKGISGIPGAKGSRGSIGFRGLKGEKGDRGIRGFQGGSNCTCSKGEKGEKGQRGLIGFTGYKGDKGEPGHKGSKGYGAKGHRGYEGLRGQKGNKGDKGDAVFSSSVAMDDWIMATQNPPVTYRAERTPSSTRTKDVITSPPRTTTTELQPTLAPRKKECLIEKIGIPLFERKAGSAVGSWMKDSTNNRWFWSTESFYGSKLFEFRSARSFRDNARDNTYDLKYFHYYGNDHAVYQGSFFYHWAGRHIILKYDLKSDFVSSAVEIPKAAYNDSMFLYKKGRSYFDIEVDENGMWVIYRQREDLGHTYVAKLDPESMSILRTWRLDVAPGTYGNGFVVCGVLYLIKDTRITTTYIDYAYDFYKDRVVPVDLEFKNPFSANSMVSYVPNRNARYSRLYAWDGGRQISYQMKFM